MQALSQKDIVRLLAFIEEINQDCKFQLFPKLLISALSKLIPADYISYNHVNQSQEMLEAVWEPVNLIIPLEEQEAILGKYLYEHPFSHAVANDFSLPATRFSDLLSQRCLQKTGLYHELYKPLDIKYQLGTGVRASHDSMVVLAHNLGHRDFTEREKQLLQLATPHIQQRFVHAKNLANTSRLLSLLQSHHDTCKEALLLVSEVGEVEWRSDHAHHLLKHYFKTTFFDQKKLPKRVLGWIKQQYKNAISHLPTQQLNVNRDNATLHIDIGISQSNLHETLFILSLSESHKSLPRSVCDEFNLTPRESEILNWLLKGMQNKEIAKSLSISPATVKKHFENIYNKLGVSHRLAAIAKIQCKMDKVKLNEMS